MPTSQNTPTNGTPLASLGEFGRIDRLTNDIALADPTSARGVGDDCAVISPRPNELLCVTGDLGAAYLGLQLLEREKQVALAQPEAKPEFGGYVYPLQRMLRPEARWDAVCRLWPRPTFAHPP